MGRRRLRRRAALAFDHGAIAPVVCVFVRRPRGDGVAVYVSLPKHLLGTFSVRLRERDGVGAC